LKPSSTTRGYAIRSRWKSCIAPADYAKKTRKGCGGNGMMKSAVDVITSVRDRASNLTSRIAVAATGATADNVLKTRHA
jgi:hypothetical protein